MYDVFVNYRKIDTRMVAAYLGNFLVGRFGADRVFLDHSAMKPGDIYPPAMRTALEQAKVLVVLIGPRWLAEDPDRPGHRLIDRGDEWVRHEIRHALARHTAIIPVLLDGASMPTKEALPDDIAGLAARQYIEISHRNVPDRMEQLVARIIDKVSELALPDLFSDVPELPSHPLPSELLTPEHRVVDFHQPDDLLTRQQSWLSSAAPLEIRLLAGAGGCGKTRLATELVVLAKSDGWQAGFVRDDAGPDEIARVAVVRAPLLVVVDYVETRGQQLVHLVEALRNRPAEWGCARVLLLARSAGQWQRVLGRHRDPAMAAFFTDMAQESIAPVATGDRRVLFTAAVRAFSHRLGGSDAHAVPPDDLDDPRYDRMLDVHAAALAAVLDALAPASMPTHADPLQRVLDHEERHWLATAVEFGLPQRADVLREVVVIATLFGGDDPRAAQAVIAAVPRLDGAGRAVVTDYRSWHAQLYPGPAALNPLRPDRLGEDVVATALTDDPELLANITPMIEEGQVMRALTVLARASPRHPVIRHAIRDILTTNPAERVVLGMTVATQVDDPVLIEVLTEVAGGGDLGPVIVENLPDGTLALAAFAVVHTEALLRAESQRVPPDRGLVAELRHNLAIRLHAVGDHDRALVMAARAVEEYRELADEDPADLLELSGALCTLADAYAQLGHSADGQATAEDAITVLDALSSQSGLNMHGDEIRKAREDALAVLAGLHHDLGDLDRAVEAIGEAVAIARELAEGVDIDEDGRARIATLAARLQTASVIHDARGELREAFEASEECVARYRELDAVEPDRYRPHLIGALGNHAGAHAELWQLEEGAKLGEEAVALARSLVARHSDPQVERLAHTINNTAALLRRLDQHDRALTYLEEAVPLYRGLADRLPGLHLAGLAAALHNLGNCLHETNRPVQAVDVYEEAIEIYRKVASPGSDDEAELAEVLVGLAHARTALDDEEEALRLAVEAVGLLTGVVRGERNRIRRRLAHALHMASTTAFDLERYAEAAGYAERAAAIYPQFADGHDREEHAAVLHGLARALDGNSEHERAAAAFADALTFHRTLFAETGSDDVRAELAGVLLNAGVCLSSLGDDDTAFAHSEEAVTIRREMLTNDPWRRFTFAEALNNLADTHCDREEWASAAEVADEAVDCARALYEEDYQDAASLTVYSLITRARSATPDGTQAVAPFLRRAWAIADDQLRELVREWAGRLSVPIRMIRR